MKRHLLILMMVLTGITMSAYDFMVDNIYYKQLSDSTVEVTYYNMSNNIYQGDVVIPPTVTFDNNEFTVVRIGNQAFVKSKNLTSVGIPNTVTEIGSAAFNDCTSLTEMAIPNSVINIGSYAFGGCSSLTSIAFPASVRGIYASMMYDCDALASIVVDPDNRYYDSRENCNAVITKNGNDLIIGCKNTTVPNSVRTIAAEAFRYCSGLTSIEIPESVIYIGERAFENCDNLVEVSLPNSLTEIGMYAFYYCERLAELRIPKSLSVIHPMAFNSCSSLAKIVVDADNQTFDSRNQCNAVIRTQDNNLVLGCKNTIIPNTVTAIGDYAFSGSTGMTSIEIPNSVTSIGKYALSVCFGLTSIVIPNSVTTIGNGAFMSCRNVTSITLSESLTTIAADLFDNCLTLTHLDIPNSVTSIGSGAFSACHKLVDVSIPNSVTSIGSEAFICCLTLPKLVIPASVTNIDKYAFCRCDKLDTLICMGTVPPAGTALCDPPYYFANVPYVKAYDRATLLVPQVAIDDYRNNEEWGRFLQIEGFEIGTDLPKTATPHVGEETQFTLTLENDEADPDATIYYAFNGGDVWLEYTEPIEFHDFGHCYFENLRFYAVAPDKLSSDTIDFDFYVHRYCYDFYVDGIYYLRTSSQTVSVSNEYDLQYRLANFTPACYSGDIVIPESITVDDREYIVTEVIPYAFFSSPRVTSLVIPNTVTYIGSDAFEVQFSSDLTKVDIGNSVEAIGVNAFYRCSKISQLICRALMPPVLEQENNNYGASFSCYGTATLFVPNESLEAYQTDEEWGKFTRIVPFIGAGPGDINGDGVVSIADVTSIINQLLTGDTPAYADVNGDGVVSINDLTALINMLLMSGH